MTCAVEFEDPHHMGRIRTTSAQRQLPCKPSLFETVTAGVSGLSLTEMPNPHAAENDVIVRVHAAGFTRGELDWPGTWADRAAISPGPCGYRPHRGRRAADLHRMAGPVRPRSPHDRADRADPRRRRRCGGYRTTARPRGGSPNHWHRPGRRPGNSPGSRRGCVPGPPRRPVGRRGRGRRGVRRHWR
jgi:hypothetical protein